ncbi:MAG: amidohydrolase family protein, partial [Acidobacteria bacterium]|nr:amidohydrolase family protein [Acidobacteriota bacterium]
SGKSIKDWTPEVRKREQEILAERRAKVLHCPGSNLKLGSGIAPVTELRARGVSVSLGSDGAACNNRLDMFEEMRLAAVLQAVRREPGALRARDVVWMATREGARALGLESEVGSIEAGKRADVIVVALDRPHVAPGPDPYSTLVYAARGTDVRATIVDGEVLVRDFRPVHLDPAEVAAEARTAARDLASRAGL